MPPPMPPPAPVTSARRPVRSKRAAVMKSWASSGANVLDRRLDERELVGAGRELPELGACERRGARGEELVERDHALAGSDRDGASHGIVPAGRAVLHVQHLDRG